MTTSFTDLSFEEARRLVEAFASERSWEPFHTPRNLLFAIMSEVGEAAEIVRWRGDEEPSIPKAHHEAWAHELADIQILLLRLADRSGVDLSAALRAKLAIAGERYPADEFRGSARKYNQDQ